MIFERQPKCLGRLAELTLTLSIDSDPLPHLIALVANARSITLTLLNFDRRVQTYAVLTTLARISPNKLILDGQPYQNQFWSTLLPHHWNTLTSVTFESMNNMQVCLTALSALPLLVDLQVNDFDARHASWHHSQDVYFFPSLRILQIEFTLEARGLIQHINAPHLSQLKITTGDYLDLPSFTELFTRLANTLNRTSLVSLIIDIFDPEQPEVPEELRGVAFHQDMLTPLYVFQHLERLEIRPGLSCHQLSDAFYENLPTHWPMLSVFYLGGDLLFPTPDPEATLVGVAAFLQNSLHIRKLSFPHVRGPTLPPIDTIYPTVESIGVYFSGAGGSTDFDSYKAWINTCLPLETRIRVKSDGPDYAAWYGTPESQIGYEFVRIQCV
jgi:hypothetical protein